MVAAAKESGKVFAIMFNQRTNKLFAKAREIVQSGQLGELKRSVWIITNWYRKQAYYDSGAWRATWSGEGGGVLLNQCPHQLDLWQWICGMPTKVHAHLHYGKWHDIEVEDDVTAYVEYENGASGVFITTTGDACGTNRFEIQLDGAKLIAENNTLEVTEFEMHEPEFSRTNTSPFGAPNTTCFTADTDGQNLQHVGVLNAWGGAILRGEPMIADGREGLFGLTISNAMHLSSWLGETVSLPFDAQLYYTELMKRVENSREKSNVQEVVADTENTYSGTGEMRKRWNTNW
jgi:predicted dehydrogenase